MFQIDFKLVKQQIRNKNKHSYYARIFSVNSDANLVTAKCNAKCILLGEILGNFRRNIWKNYIMFVKKWRKENQK